MAKFGDFAENLKKLLDAQQKQFEQGAPREEHCDCGVPGEIKIDPASGPSFGKSFIKFGDGPWIECKGVVIHDSVTLDAGEQSQQVVDSLLRWFRGMTQPQPKCECDFCQAGQQFDEAMSKIKSMRRRHVFQG